MTERIVRITQMMVVITCILLLISIYPAFAQGSSGSSTGGSSTGGSSASGSRGGGQGMAGSTTFGGNIGPGQGFQTGGTSPMSQSGASTGFGPQDTSTPPGFQSNILQQNIYGSPGAPPIPSGSQPGTYGSGNIQSTIYGGGYGGYTQQGPAPGGGVASVQAMGGEPVAAECMTGCTELYTPFECRTIYCSVNDKNEGGVP